MTEIIITEKLLYEYSEYLTAGERASATVERYLRAVWQFAAHLSGAAANRESAAAWRDRLLETGCAPSGVNVSVAAVNAFFAMLGAQERIKPLRIQRRLFRPAKRELTRGEYERLVDAARLRGRERLALLSREKRSRGLAVVLILLVILEVCVFAFTPVRIFVAVRFPLLYMIPGMAVCALSE